MTSVNTDFCSSIFVETSVTTAGDVTTGGGVIFGVGNKPNVNDDCPPEGANTRDVVRLIWFRRCVFVSEFEKASQLE